MDLSLDADLGVVGLEGAVEPGDAVSRMSEPHSPA